jgi:hypothetical protein
MNLLCIDARTRNSVARDLSQPACGAMKTPALPLLLKTTTSCALSLPSLMAKTYICDRSVVPDSPGLRDRTEKFPFSLRVLEYTYSNDPGTPFVQPEDVKPPSLYQPDA